MVATCRVANSNLALLILLVTKEKKHAKTQHMIEI